MGWVMVAVFTLSRFACSAARRSKARRRTRPRRLSGFVISAPTFSPTLMVVSRPWARRSPGTNASRRSTLAMGSRRS